MFYFSFFLYLSFLPFSLSPFLKNIVSDPDLGAGEPWVVFLFLFIGHGPGLSLAAKERKAGARKGVFDGGCSAMCVRPADRKCGGGD